MTKAELLEEIERLWRLYERASTERDQRGFLAEIAWLEHKAAEAA